MSRIFHGGMIAIGFVSVGFITAAACVKPSSDNAHVYDLIITEGHAIGSGEITRNDGGRDERDDVTL